MPTLSPRPTPRARRRRSPPSAEDRALVELVARFSTVVLPTERNWLVCLTLIAAAFPGISLEHALVGHVFRKLVLRKVLQ